MPTVIETIAAWAAAPHTFSPIAQTRAAQAITDTLACMVAGETDPATAAVRSAMAPHGTHGPARLVGGGTATASVAALVNGTAAHALDYDDNFLPAISHASAVIVPALLAIAEQTQASGADFVTAYLIALQAQAHVGQGVGYAHYAAGWHGTSTTGSIGTAAGTAWLLGLDAAGIARALTLGTSMASGIKGQFGTPAKPFHAGMAARNAVEAALLAQAGLSGRLDILEGAQGFRALYAGGTPTTWWEDTPEIPAAHVIETSGLMPKRHPCCGSTHLVLDTVIDLQKTHGFTAAQVARVDTRVGLANWRNLAYPAPINEMQARFSMQYCVARTLHKGVLGLADFTQASVDRYASDPLLQNITMDYDPQSSSIDQPHQTTITLTSGAQLHGTRHFAKGTINDPFTADDRQTKFTDCTRHIAPPATLFATCEAIATQPDLAFLGPLFT
ncbi:MmgE/PrpD family protein (plasmid) [Ketogulonicigenium robustum]|uniref:MmgE/PrpD family protein n=1 Tax=Ketogulonicigenium robustum TaxID=92947 RepID=A0A1W6P2Z1_9RHOB|nr:MmgE/PrpD family protein [Ketogulonicigenium robustum]ARO15814.1 MmgE/PrpD family protein [Ketogulonicigenium robustum]